MPLPCGHSWGEPAVPNCVICRIRDVPANRERWGGGKGPKGRKPVGSAAAFFLGGRRRSLPCQHLGQKIAGQTVGCVRKCYHVCEAGFGDGGRTRPAFECAGCSEYVPDGGEPEVKEAGPFDQVGEVAAERPEPAPKIKPIAGVGFHFSHHGDLGDIIYALPSVKSVCEASGLSARLYPYPRLGTRETMSPRRAANLLPLLLQQDYVADAEFSPEPVGVKLDAARRFRFIDPGAGLNIAEQYRQWLALPPFDRSKPWLRVDRVERVAPVVFARSPRYRPKGFPWKRIAERYGRDAVFVGTMTEYHAFCAEVSAAVPYHPTPTLLDVARVIAGADLFVGNQSSPRAIAEGLKVAVVVEESDKVPDTKFLRKGAWYGRRDDFWCEALDDIEAAKVAKYRDYREGN